MRERRLAGILVAGLLLSATTVAAGDPGDDIRIFGYFQNQFMHLTSSTEADGPPVNSFVLQQLNILMQRDFGARWTAFVNLEFTNAYSSERMTGDLNLEEAWVRYVLGSRASLKLGLQIPEFNRLNTIKTKTPLLPYIVRPLVYESSLSTAIGNHEFVPNQAYAQLYGALPVGQAKIDYAFYLGNTPNITTKPIEDQSGVDTTDAVLVGGRLGVRVGEAKAGISITNEKVGPDALERSDEMSPETRQYFVGIIRRRIGGDVSFRVRGFRCEAEVIDIAYDDDSDRVNFDKDFQYVTAGYEATEALFVYVTYWRMHEFDVGVLDFGFGPVDFEGEIEWTVPSLGAAYHIGDRITVKAQSAQVRVDSKTSIPVIPEHREFFYHTIAVSVIF